MVRKNILFATISYGFKFFSNAVLIILMARILGPERFGIIAFAMTVSVFLGVIVDYGFNLQITKNIAQAPSLIECAVSRMVIAKLFIAISVLCVSSVFFLFETSKAAILVVLFTTSMTICSFGQFFFSVFRGLSRFKEETKFTFISNVFLLGSLVPVIMLKLDYVWIAACFLLSRLFYLAASIKLFLSEFKFTLKEALSSSQIMRVLYEGFPFGMLVGSGYLFLSIDTFLVKSLFDNESVGIYQSGLRFVFASLVIAESIVSAYLPILARLAVEDKDIFQEKATELINISLIVALFLSAFLLVSPVMIVNVILGNAYNKVAQLLPLFGIIIILRFLIASYGTILTARGYQNDRTRAVISSLVCFIITATILVKFYGLIGVVAASVTAHIIMLSLYWRSVHLADKKSYFYVKESSF